MQCGPSLDARSQRLLLGASRRCQSEAHCCTLQEEQERELSPKIEQEKQIQKAPPGQTRPHELHPDVVRFATSGILTIRSNAYIPAFASLGTSSAAKTFAASQLGGSEQLLVTMDFANTVTNSSQGHISDAFHRQVHGTDTIDTVMIISPYEANQLLPRMEKSTNTTLHLYKPRTNSGYASMDELNFHTVSTRATTPIIPRSLAVRLNIFAGQLYISSHEDYQEVCNFFGLSATTLTGEMSKQGWRVDAEGFIISDGKGRIGGESGLKKSPVGFVKTLLSTIRRNGEGITKTHMASLHDGKLLRAEDFGN